MYSSDSVGPPVTLTLEEAANIIGVGRTKAYQMARNGTFPVPVHRLGCRYVIPLRGVADYVNMPLDALQALVATQRFFDAHGVKPTGSWVHQHVATCVGSGIVAEDLN